MQRMRKRGDKEIMATIWTRNNTEEQWRTNPQWRGFSREHAHQVADRYNKKREDNMYWVTDGEQPSKNKVPDGKEHL